MSSILYTLAAATLKNGNTVDIPTPQADDVLNGVLSLVYIVASIVCVIVIIIAGIMYVTSEGDSGKTASAKNAILYAIVGLLLVGVAFVITGFIVGRF